jgi:hypothetical protein
MSEDILPLSHTHCSNCGHETHCGTNLMKDFWSVWDKRLGEIEVCKHCRCANCSQQEEPKTDK